MPSDITGTEVIQEDPETHQRSYKFLSGPLFTNMLARRGEEFWPPVYSGHGIQIGAFVVKFKLQNQPDSDPKNLLADLAAESEIIRLAPDVIEKRMQVAAEDEL